MVGLVTLILAASVIDFYPSPANRTPNVQINQADFISMGFFFSTASSLNNTYDFSSQQVRFGAALFGVDTNPYYPIPGDKHLLRILIITIQVR